MKRLIVAEKISIIFFAFFYGNYVREFLIYFLISYYIILLEIVIYGLEIVYGCAIGCFFKEDVDGWVGVVLDFGIDYN